MPSTLRAADAGPRVIPQVDISGSKLNDVVKYLRASGGVNIVLPPALADLPVPDLALANVTAEGVLNSFAAIMPQIAVQTVADSNGAQIINIIPAKANAAAKVCRVFKASAKEKLQREDLEQLIKNLAEAARMVCEANARAQGRPNTELPTIEAHPPTGILIVTGEESDVQVLGQVVQALGGEVIPLTDPKPMLLNLPNGTTGFMNVGKGFSVDLSKGINAMTLNVSPQIEQAQKQVEQAKNQAGKAVKQMEEALKQITIQVKPAEKK
jgi:hypothetical protein